MLSKRCGYCLGWLMLCLWIVNFISAGEESPSVYRVISVKNPPVIDGNLDDAIWGKSQFTHLYDFLASTTASKVLADPATTFAITADEKKIYVAFRCRDTNIKKINRSITTRDGKIWNGDNVEIFLNFDRNGHHFGRVMLGASGALFDAAYLQYGLREHRWYNIKGLAGAATLHADHWTGEIAIPFAGLAMKPHATGNWPINICRSSQTKQGVRYYHSSWGVLDKKIKLDKPNFFPITLIRSTRSEKIVYDLFQEVAGIPQPVFTQNELKEMQAYRQRQQFDKPMDKFQTIVIPPQLPLESLMYITDSKGVKQPIKTESDCLIKRQQSLVAMQKAMGQLPARPQRSHLKDFNIQTTDMKIRGRYTQRHIHYNVAQGETVHAYLFEPLGLKPGEKRPGIIALHPTAKFGKQTFEGWPNSNFVTELAMQGFVVIVPDYPTLGESQNDDLATDRYASGPIRGVFNHMCSVDLLQLLPSVDPERIGAIGHSLGGRNTLYLQAFDERVQVGVSSCGWTTFRSKTLLEERLLATEYFMPLLKTKYQLDLAQFPFEYTDAFAAIAPRVFYSYSPAGDGVHPGWGTSQAAPIIQEYYRACGAKEAFIFRQPAGGHRFPWVWRQNSYRVLRDSLNYHPAGQLGLLAERKGNLAIPQLIDALDDASPKKRWVAAHFLGLLGNRTGLARMKQDFLSLTQNRQATVRGDKQQHSQLVLALEVAKVLAELGDTMGYSLAAELAIEGANGLRWRATEVLAIIANLDQAVLKKKSIDPLSVLKKMAATEKDNDEFFVYLDRVHKILRDRSEMVAIFAIAKKLAIPDRPQSSLGIDCSGSLLDCGNA